MSSHLVKSTARRLLTELVAKRVLREALHPTYSKRLQQEDRERIAKAIAARKAAKAARRAARVAKAVERVLAPVKSATPVYFTITNAEVKRLFAQHPPGFIMAGQFTKGAFVEWMPTHDGTLGAVYRNIWDSTFWLWRISPQIMKPVVVTQLKHIKPHWWSR
jgi:hypothetical protein